jgi:hypothetical protein
MTKPTTKDKIIDSVLDDFERFWWDIVWCEKDEDELDKIKSFLRTKLEKIVLDVEEVVDVIAKVERDISKETYESTQGGQYASNLEDELAKAITAQQAKGV